MAVPMQSPVEESPSDLGEAATEPTWSPPDPVPVEPSVVVPGPVAWEDPPPRPRFEAPVLSFEPGPEEPHRSLLMIVVRALKLDVWGWWGLNRRAAIEMESAEVMLLAVYAFELMAWGLLFNVIIHGSTWEVSPLSWIAVVVALLFATVIFIFEKSFVTADFSTGTSSKVAGYFIRLGIILASALATSQPVELMVFGDAIDARIYEETVRAEVLREAADVIEARERSDVQAVAVALSEATSETREYQDWREADEAAATSSVRLASGEAALAQASADVDKYSGAKGYWRSQKTRRQALADLDPSDSALAEAVATADRYYKGNSWALRKAERAQDEAQAELAAAQAAAGAARSTLDRRMEEKRIYRESIETGMATQAERARDDLETRTAWIDQVMAGNHRAIPTRVLDERLAPLQMQHADFTQRLAILADLRAGRPARWPASDTETRLAACDLFGLCDEAASEDPVTQARTADAAMTFRLTYWAAFVIAVVIPLLTMAFKLLMPRELKAYYSTVGQARAGNPAAVKAMCAAGEEHLI